MSYGTAKLKKCGDFCALTWLIFADLVTFVQGYNLEVHDVTKYMRKHRTTVIISCHCNYRATVIISRASQFYLSDKISRSRNSLSSPSKVRFTPC